MPTFGKEGAATEASSALRNRAPTESRRPFACLWTLYPLSSEMTYRCPAGGMTFTLRPETARLG